MKCNFKILPIVFVLFLSTAFKSQAQILTNSITYAIDSFSSYCTVPAPGYFYASGIVSAVNPPAANDSVTVYMNYDDGSDTTYNTAYTGSFGGGYYYYIYLNHTYTASGTYTPMIISTTSNNLIDTFILQPVTISNGCANLQGNVYVDANSNCVKDAGELPIIYTAVKAVNTTTNHAYYAYTDTSGHYGFNLVDGFTYTLTPYQTLNNILAPTCPLTGTAVVAVATGGNYTKDFGYNCNNVQADVAVTGFATNWRVGANRPIAIHVSSNTFCDTFSGVVTVTLSAPLSFTTNWTVTPSAQTATSASWNVTDISLFHQWSVYGSVYCDSSANQGDTLCANVTITPTPMDANAQNNSYDICAAVNNSYDPNDKAVAPRGYGIAGNIPNSTKLTYLIRFQNTGNDTAYNVSIDDTLSQNLDWASVNIIQSSHAVIPSLSDAGVLNFKFNNIYLPDSNVNEAASHGFVMYSVMPKSNLSLGTTITNQAHIYFDMNNGIPTNTTLNTIAQPQSVQHLEQGNLDAIVYPNPAGNKIYVELNSKDSYDVFAYDMMGRKVMSEKGIAGKCILKVQDLPEGLYILRIVNQQKEESSVKVSIKY